LRLLNKLPKYGNDMDEPDALFEEIIGFIVKEFEKYTPIFNNGRYIPSVFCWEMHERFGRETGASPDGRKAGFPLGDGSGPCQGREKGGPTASILSTTKWSHKELIGGVALNMKFGKKTMTKDAHSKMISLIKTYLDRGGFEMQINVVDKEALLKAKENPENYSDLVVRIGGYSDYFTRITDKMQDEVILRTEHEI
ncbi:MAG: glycyl radical protein, partial [Clostridia bacterium]|nr:glycyl radical protein [Clostridia bacterium]